MTGTIGSWLLCAFLTPRRVFRGAIRERAQGRACRRTRSGEKEGVGDGGAAAAVFECLVFRQWCMNTMSEDTDSPSVFFFFAIILGQPGVDFFKPEMRPPRGILPRRCCAR